MQAALIHSFARRCWPALTAWAVLAALLLVVVLS